MLPLIYLFEQMTINNSGSNHSQFAKLLASDGAAGDYFGYSVSISGDGNTAIVGAYQDDTRAGNAGSASIYTRSGSTWSRQTKLMGGDEGDVFGYSVAISSDGNTAIIGAWGDDDKGRNSGSAHIYTRSGSTWTRQSKLVPSDGAASDRFGNSVSISTDGNTAIIGAWSDDSIGSAYIFVR